VLLVGRLDEQIEFAASQQVDAGGEGVAATATKSRRCIGSRATLASALDPVIVLAEAGRALTERDVADVLAIPSPLPTPANRASPAASTPASSSAA